MEALPLGIVGLVVGVSLSPLVTTLAAWPNVEPAAGSAPRLCVSRDEAGFARPLALALERPRQTILMALTVGALFAAAALRYGDAGELAIVLAYGAVFVICAATDMLSFRVPNAVTYPALLGALALAAIMPDIRLSAALAGAAVGGGFLLAFSILSRGGIGLGDVKLAAFAGLALGWPMVLPTLFLTAVAGGIASGLVLLLRVRGPKDPLPYAPFIAIAAVAVMLSQGTAFHEL